MSCFSQVFLPIILSKSALNFAINFFLSVRSSIPDQNYLMQGRFIVLLIGISESDFNGFSPTATFSFDSTHEDL